VLGYKAGMDIDETREQLPRLATLPFDPTYKLMATFHTATDAAGRPVAVLRQGRGAGRDGPRRHRPLRRRGHHVGCGLE
jgi:Cation transport ATPase